MNDLTGEGNGDNGQWVILEFSCMQYPYRLTYSFDYRKEVRE
jgi:hypothetical protein